MPTTKRDAERVGRLALCEQTTAGDTLLSMSESRREERLKSEGAPEDVLRAGMGVRWYVVVADTGEPELPPNPPGGFATEDERASSTGASCTVIRA